MTPEEQRMIAPMREMALTFAGLHNFPLTSFYAVSWDCAFFVLRDTDENADALYSVRHDVRGLRIEYIGFSDFAKIASTEMIALLAKIGEV